VVSAVQAFYASVVDDAIVRGEIPAKTDAPAVVSMLLAMFLGMGFYAGFIVDQNNMAVIAKQLHRLMTQGLLDQEQNGRTLSFTPPMPAGIDADEFPHAWSGLTG
jgi:hypothetical protein